MKLDDWLTKSTTRLSNAGISSARLDCLILLEDATGKDRSWLLAHPEHVLPDDTVHKLDEQLTRRSAHEPLAYIRSKSEFYGREFRVNAHTLQPRPETETMIDLLQELVESCKLKVASQKTAKNKTTSQKQQAKTGKRLHGSDAVQGEAEHRTKDKKAPALNKQLQHLDEVQGASEQQADAMLTVVDVGTGSGCIAITTKLLYPEARVIAIDIDDQCIEIAQKNAAAHHADVTFFKGDLLKPLTNPSASSAGKQSVGGRLILLANLPYVPDEHIINRAATHEPRHAIFGGADGLDYYRSLFEQARNLTQPPAYIFTEALPPQHNTLSRIAEKHGYSETNQDDFIQLYSIKTDI